MRIFLDANILFSAAKSEGAMHRFLDLLQQAGHRLCADGYVVEEARRNLAVKAANRLETLSSILSRIEVASFQPAGSSQSTRPSLPEKDHPVLASAIQMRCDALLTGDRTHFGKFWGRTIAGVTIHSPSSLAAKALR